jgi:hypothetical protein
MCVSRLSGGALSVVTAAKSARQPIQGLIDQCIGSQRIAILKSVAPSWIPVRTEKYVHDGAAKLPASAGGHVVRHPNPERQPRPSPTDLHQPTDRNQDSVSGRNPSVDNQQTSK